MIHLRTTPFALDFTDVILEAVAGLVLFLYGVTRLSDSLKRLAGDRMKNILAKSTVNPLAGVLIERLLQAGTGRVQQLKVSEDATQRKMTVDYTDFRPLDQQTNLPFAHALLVKAQESSAGVVTAAVNYTKVNAGRERLTFPFAVPKGYRRSTK